MPSDRLCDVCERLNLEALLLAAEAAPPVHKSIVLNTSKTVETVMTHKAVYNFAEHHKDLVTLQSAAAHCRFCSAIWDDFCRQRQPHELTPQALTHGRANEQIFVGTLEWDPNTTAVPHVVVSQRTPDKQNYVPLATFEACAEYQALPLQNDHLLARLQATSAADEICCELGRKWIEDCQTKHSTCRPAHELNIEMPTRLLDVGLDSDLVPKEAAPIRLVQGQACKGAYAALSYCWGPDRDFLLTHKSEAMLRAGFQVSEMPGTLRDAVIVARNTGISYLWIDALCIFQDQQEYQESRDDWARESGRMRDVYRGAVVTIEAASASRASEGFLSPRTSLQPYCPLPWGDKHVYLRPRSEAPERDLYGTTIYTRGWTMQERLLAPRTLSFGLSQVSFHCANGYTDEAGRPSKITSTQATYLSKEPILQIRNDRSRLKSGVRALLRGSGAAISTSFGQSKVTQNITYFTQGRLLQPNGKWQTYYDFWRGLVERFSQRQLTSNNDKLPAMSGLADEFRQATGDTYLAGLWQGELIECLAWECSNLHNPAKREAWQEPGEKGLIVFASNFRPWPDVVKPVEPMAPSWSWASVSGTISHVSSSQVEDENRTKHVAKVIEAKATPQYSSDPCGGVKPFKSYIVLDTQFLAISNPFTDECEPEFSDILPVHSKIRQSYIDLNEHFTTEAYQHHQPHDNQRFALIELMRRGQAMDSRIMLLIESCAVSTEPPQQKGKKKAAATEQEEWRRLCCLTFSTEQKTRAEVREEFSHLDEDDEYLKYIFQQWEGMNTLARAVMEAEWARRRVRLV